MRNLAVIAVFMLAIVAGAHAQSSLQTYTPSKLLGKGQFEAKIFNNLYYQNKAFNSEGKKEETMVGNEYYFTMLNQFLYGVNDKVNIGADLWVKHVNKPMSEKESRTAVSGFGPKIKIAPFDGIKGFSIQSTFLFPIATDQEGRNEQQNKDFLAFDRHLWINQFFYDADLSDKLQIFVQMSLWYSIVRESFVENNFLETPVSGFLSYFPNDKWTLYAMTEYWPTHYNYNTQQAAAFNQYFVQSGLGVKNQLIKGKLELELLYTNFWKGSQGQGAGSTINLGFRIIN